MIVMDDRRMRSVPFQRLNATSSTDTAFDTVKTPTTTKPSGNGVVDFLGNSPAWSWVTVSGNLVATAGILGVCSVPEATTTLRVVIRSLDPEAPLAVTTNAPASSRSTAVTVVPVRTGRSNLAT